MPHRLPRFLRTIPLLAWALLLTACAGDVKIADINRDPARYANRDVSITGTAVQAVGALGQGAFELDDGTGRLWVISEGFGVPSQGARVRVTGRVQQGVTFVGRSFGTVLRETEKRKDL